MDALECMRSRSMFRGRLQPRKLADEDLHQLVEAARWAPSGHNSQPWEFLVVDDADLIGEIARIASERFDAFLQTSNDLQRFVANFSRWLRWSEDALRDAGDGIFFARMPRGAWDELTGLADQEAIRQCLIAMFGSRGIPSKLISTAPCIILTLVDTRRAIPDHSNDLMALTSTGAAMQNLRLAATALGIAVHEQSPLYDLPDTRAALGELLDIPTHCRIIGGMRLGYPGDPVRSSLTHVRRPVEAVMHRNLYRDAAK